MDENIFITSKDDLLDIISKCPKCLNSTGNGTFIMSYDQLCTIRLTEKYANQKVINFIINSSKSDGVIGHWANIVIFNRKMLFFLDGLNEMKNNPEIMNCIYTFSEKNNLKLYQFNVRYQSKRSKKCGFLACFIVHKSTQSTVSKFLNLRKLLVQNSIKTNEQSMLNSVKKTFKIKFY